MISLQNIIFLIPWLVGALEHFWHFPINIGLLIIPIDEVIFFRGVFPQPPTRWAYPTTNHQPNQPITSPWSKNTRAVPSWATTPPWWRAPNGGALGRHAVVPRLSHEVWGFRTSKKWKLPGKIWNSVGHGSFAELKSGISVGVRWKWGILLMDFEGKQPGSHLGIRMFMFIHWALQCYMQ